MLWKPHEPVYPRLIKTTIDGLSIDETKAMRKKGLAVPALTKLAKNGYYGSLVPMVRDAFLVSELVRIDCLGLERKDYKKIGAKLRVRCFFLSLSLSLLSNFICWSSLGDLFTASGFCLNKH
jgi:hypothetical protein